MACAEALDSTWLVDPEEEVTLVDKARMWLDEQAENDPRLHKVLPDVMKYARAYVKRWSTAFLDRVHELRNQENNCNQLGLNSQTALEASGVLPAWACHHRPKSSLPPSEYSAMQAHQLAPRIYPETGTIIKSLMNDHDTFSVFLSDCNDGLTRYQRWMVLVTLVLVRAGRGVGSLIAILLPPAHTPEPVLSPLSGRSAHYHLVLQLESTELLPGGALGEKLTVNTHESLAWGLIP